MLDPTDWRGIGFSTMRSATQQGAIRALGAEPVEVFGRPRRDALEHGTIQPFELNLDLAADTHDTNRAPYTAANVHSGRSSTSCSRTRSVWSG